MDWKVQLFKLNFDHLERVAVNDVLDSGWLTMGEKTSRFESEFSQFLGGEVQSIAVSNATAALHMSLLASEVQSGDEVIISGLTFIADANVVKMCGAKVVLADCESLDNWNLSAKTIETKINARTKAVIIVHFAGYPCDMVPIVNLCRKHNIILIEDTAHAPGASVDGQMCGTFGDIGCFSFFSNKNLSIGEGGMVVAKDPSLVQKLKHLRSHGMTTLSFDRHQGRSSSYDVMQPGLNYRMDEIRAALGLVQLSKLKDGNEKRRILTDIYRDRLSKINISMPFVSMRSGMRSAYHILPILLPSDTDRGLVIQSMKDKYIQTSIHYPPFWDFHAYRDECRADDCPVISIICPRELTLPLYPTMTEDEVNLVCITLEEAL